MVEGKMHILLVEDNPEHVKLVLRCIKNHPVLHHVYVVTDGEEALDFLYHRGKYSDPAHSLRPHVIFLDLRMPKIDGISVLKEIKSDSHLQSIPVVVFTTSESEKDIENAYGYYANSYIVKPVDYDEFLKVIETLGTYWLQLNRLPYS